MLVRTFDSSEELCMEVTFELTPARQFDQGGLFVRVDDEHWIKAGIEVVDGKPRLSCVVTNGQCSALKFTSQPFVPENLLEDTDGLRHPPSS